MEFNSEGFPIDSFRPRLDEANLTPERVLEMWELLNQVYDRAENVGGCFQPNTFEIDGDLMDEIEAFLYPANGTV